MDQVLVGIASIPQRASSLERVLESLAPQADRVHVALNGYDVQPDFLYRFENVSWTLNGPDNLGDAEKFAKIDDWCGYIATCDDDILYPHDYIATLVAGIERYGRETLVSFHGGTTQGFSERSHGAATVKRLPCLQELAEDDVNVNAVGTGVLGWHSDFVPLWRGVFRTPNMADVYLACHAHRFAIPMVVLAHRQGWLKNIQPPGPSIYEGNRHADGTVFDTRAERKRELDSIDWTQPPRRPKVRVSVATHEREELLWNLLTDLEASSIPVHVAVYQDPGMQWYEHGRQLAVHHEWEWHRMVRKLGREQHWKLVTQEMQGCMNDAADYFVFLPDDVRLERHAIAKAIDTWRRLDDPSTLTLWRLREHEDQTNWTGRKPVELEHAFEVFHVDGIYLCQRRTLEELGFTCPRPPRDWYRRFKSSGVGRQMSITMHKNGKRMYRVKKSLAIPVRDVPSMMNPDCDDRLHPWVAL